MHPDGLTNELHTTGNSFMMKYELKCQMLGMTGMGIDGLFHPRGSGITVGSGRAARAPRQMGMVDQSALL